MGAKTAIEWTDATWNPIRGCSRVSDGCRHCYAETMAARFSGPGQPYEGLAHRISGDPRWTGKVALAESHLTDPLRWSRPRRIFVNSMSDLFHEAVPDEWILRIIDVVRRCSWDGGSNIGRIDGGRGEHTFQVLTKRAPRMATFMRRLRFNPMAEDGECALFLSDDARKPLVLKNLWLGVSVEDQAAADTRIPALLDTPAALRFLSCEPLIGPVDLLCRETGSCPTCPQCLGGLGWVIAGGESGPHARPMNPEWVRALRDQCTAAAVPFFFKQWGEWTPGENVDRSTGVVDVARWFGGAWRFGRENLANEDGHIDDRPDVYRVGKRAAGRLIDGRTWDDFPTGASS